MFCAHAIYKAFDQLEVNVDKFCLEQRIVVVRISAGKSQQQLGAVTASKDSAIDTPHFATETVQSQ